MEYQIFLLNDADRIVARLDVDRRSDGDALNDAFREMSLQPRERGVIAIEVWHDREIISRVDCRRAMAR